jgi:cytochrome c556
MAVHEWRDLLEVIASALRAAAQGAAEKAEAFVYSLDLSHHISKAAKGAMPLTEAYARADQTKVQFGAAMFQELFGKPRPSPDSVAAAREAVWQRAMAAWRRGDPIRGTLDEACAALAALEKGEG